MNLPLLHESLRDKAHFSFSKSGGPGGQNVNKVNTKVELRVMLSELEGLSIAELIRIRERLSNRLTTEGEIQIISSEERTQGANKENAIIRLENLIISSSKAVKKRIPTKPSRSSKEKRLKTKRKVSIIKKDRGSAGNGND